MSKPFIFTLFGSTGDLTKKKVMPALFKLFQEGRLSPQFSIIAFSRRTWTDEDYRTFIRPFLHETKTLETFLSHITYCEGHFQDGESFMRLQLLIEQKTEMIGQAEKLFYFAVQPNFYDDILHGLSVAQLLKDPQAKVLVEKPFGHDRISAQHLESTFEQKMKSEQLLRVDHYLAKEGVRNLVARKKSERDFESLLNNEHISSIHLRIFETIGIEGRGDFYDRIGALLDVGQNHMLEMLVTLLAKPGAKNQSQGRVEVLRSLTVSGNPVFGQYVGYLSELEVSPISNIETYFKIELESSLPAWKNIPIILEAGKAMAEKRADIVLTKKDGSEIIIDIQNSPSGRDAYELLLEEAINGHDDYFVSFEEVMAAWHIIDPIVKKRATLDVKKYPQGTNGPTQ